MDNRPGTDTNTNDAPGTLAKFHLGLAADGTSCAMVFVDDHQHSIGCIASFSDLMGFISSLQRVAREMARRQPPLDEGWGRTGDARHDQRRHRYRLCRLQDVH